MSESWVLCHPECTDEACAPDCPGSRPAPAAAEVPAGMGDEGYYRACAGCDAPCGCPLTTPASTVPDNATLRTRVQRILGRRIGAPAIQLTADLFQPGEGPLAGLLAKQDELARQVAAVRELADRWDGLDPGRAHASAMIRRALGDPR